MKPTLHSFAGRPATPDLAIDLRTWSMLPPQCRKSFWDLLLPNLAPTPEPAITTRVRELMTQLEVSPQQVAPSLKACRRLFRSAAKFAVPPEAFGEDCAALLGDELELRSLLQRWYSDALPILRQELEESSLVEHGATASDLSWRVSMVTRSQRGAAINRVLATMTFEYLEGKERKHFTLNLLPEMVLRLRDACDEIIGPEAGAD